MAKSTTQWLLIIAVVAVGYFLLFGNPFEKEPVAPVQPTVPGTPTGVQCLSSTTPDLDINTHDKENPGTAITETSIYRRVGDTQWTGFTSGTAITNLIVGEQYDVILGIGTADADQYDNAYGPTFRTTVPCAEMTVMDVAMYNDEVDTSLTATFYNNDDNAATAETFIAGQVQDVTLKWQAGNDEVFGNPFLVESGLGDNGNHRAKYPNALCMHLNSTAWDVPDAVLFEGVEMRRISTPIIHNANAASTHAEYCYEAPIITDVGQKIIVRLNADDTNAPSKNDTAYLYAGGFYIDNDDSVLKWGVEDEQGNPVAADAEDSLTLIFA